MGAAATEMSRRGLGSLAVVDGRKFVGVVTERDLVRAMAAGVDVEESPVSEWMGVDPDTFDPEVDVWDAAEWVLEAGYRHLPVVEDDELLGVVSLRDLLRAVVTSAE